MSVRFLAFALAAATLSLAVVGMSGAGEAPASPRRVVADRPLKVCLAPDGGAARDLREGIRRAVLAVHAYSPSGQGAGHLEVTHVATGQTTRIGFFPGGPFAATSPAEVRRHFLPSAGGAADAGFCYSIVMIGGEGAAADVALELSDRIPR